MNSQLLEKFITSTHISCPEFIYENPILDKNVANALSKSFLKILTFSQQSSTINNLRLTILENIRKTCRIEPENHVKIDESLTNLLFELYKEKLGKLQLNIDSTDKYLDSFLLRRMKERNLDSSFESSLNPEIIQSLINLNHSGTYLDYISQDIIHWNSSNSKHICMLKDLWRNKIDDSNKYCNDISIKLKTEIERLLLKTVCHILSNKDSDILGIISDDIALNNLLKQCSEYPNCFQICSGILNFLFIETNFDIKLQQFIQIFIRHVKENCSLNTFSALYPVQISHIVVLLDFDINLLCNNLRNEYVKSAMKYLLYLQSSSENELVMLLSHFPQWFDVYYAQRNLT